MIDDFLEGTTRKDYLFTRQYKVVDTFKKVRGKWPAALTDSVFMDSGKFHRIYFDMISNRIEAIL